MSRIEEIRKTIPEAMKAKDSVRLGVARMVQAALKNREIEKKAPLDETEAQQVVATLAKQRRESIEQFRRGSREDLAAKEEQELEFLSALLPPQLNQDEIVQQVEQVITEVGATGPQDIGKVMKPVMAKLAGQADGGLVRQVVQEKLKSR